MGQQRKYTTPKKLTSAVSRQGKQPMPRFMPQILTDCGISRFWSQVGVAQAEVFGYLVTGRAIRKAELI